MYNPPNGNCSPVSKSFPHLFTLPHIARIPDILIPSQLQPHLPLPLENASLIPNGSLLPSNSLKSLLGQSVPPSEYIILWSPAIQIAYLHGQSPLLSSAIIPSNLLLLGQTWWNTSPHNSQSRCWTAPAIQAKNQYAAYTCYKNSSICCQSLS